MTRIVPNLWFDTEAEEAVAFYTSLFPNSEVTRVIRNTPANEGETGTPVVIEFVLDGRPFSAINGGPLFPFTEAVSLAIECVDQAESDRLWNAITAEGEESKCGWCKDRWGLSWQVFPAELADLLADPDPGRAARAMGAMLEMKRIDLEVIRLAADSE